jgi:hypothetical protein
MGPRAVRSNREPSDLLDAAGFDDVEAIDLTESFLETARGWYEHTSELERDLRATAGDAAFDQQQADRREMVTAIEEGLLISGALPRGEPDPRSTMKRSE